VEVNPTFSLTGYPTAWQEYSFTITGLTGATTGRIGFRYYLFDLNGFSNTIGSLSGAGTVTDDDAAAATLTVGNDNTSTTFSGILENGTGVLQRTKTGTGTLTLTGNNTYTGATNVAAGILQAGSATAFSANSAYTVTSVLDLNGFSNTIGSLSGTGTVTNDGAAAAATGSDGYYSSTCHRCAEPSCRQNAQLARPTYSDHPGEGTAGLAEGGGLRETFTRGNRDVSLQDPDRSHAARSHTHGSENGSSAGLLRDQSDDPMRDAGLPASLILEPGSPSLSLTRFMHQRLDIFVSCRYLIASSHL
jgi:autotransporter-associated beta strand protein